MIVHPLPAEGLLRAREQGAQLHPLDRALLLLRLADPDGPQDPAEWPLAERDARLLALRRSTLGDELPCTTHCPRCGEVTEFSLSTEALQAGLGPSPEPEVIEAEGWRLTLRALDSRDLAAVARMARAAEQGTDGDVEVTDDKVDAAGRRLVRRALVLGGDGQPSAWRWPSNEERPDRSSPSPPDPPSDPLSGPLANVPADLLAQAEARVAVREAAADIAIDLACPACTQHWTEGLDIGAHLWLELEAAAQRLLHEVVVLAKSFGWAERDILALPPARRRAYLQAIGGDA
jgi:hypothetical protein